MKHRILTRVLTAAAAVLLLFSLVGCGASGGTSAASTAAAVAPQKNFDAPATAEAGLTDTAAQDRKLITNAEVNLETTEFEAAMAQIEQSLIAVTSLATGAGILMLGARPYLRDRATWIASGVLYTGLPGIALIWMRGTGQGLALTLFTLTLWLNIVALYVVRKYREQYE